QKLAMMEQLVITSTIMRNYTVESLDQRDILLPAFAFVLMSVKPIRIKFRPRNLKILEITVQIVAYCVILEYA
ncbi:hypothetical protein CEXT_682921, partial [Caerostris extrusa]